MNRLIKTFLVILTFSFLPTSLFSCGCTDSPAAKAGAKQINTSFDASDSKLAQVFEQQIELVNSVLQLELDGQDKLSQALNFQIDSIAELNNLSFELNKQALIKAMP